MSQKQVLKSWLLVSIAIVYINDLAFKNSPEIFLFGDELGSILSNLSLAYISSYIFYVVVVVAKEKRDKQNIYSAVYALTKTLLHNAFSVLDFTIEAAGLDPRNFNRDTITKEEFLNICSTANLHGIPSQMRLGAPNNLRTVNFAEFIKVNCVQNVSVYTEKIFNYMPFLDSEFVKRINDLHQCLFFIRFANVLPIFAPSASINPIIAGHMYDYFELARKLDRYNKNENKKHIMLSK